MPEQMPEHAETLQRLGFALPMDALSDPKANPLGAVVFLGGCSASFVSADGLIITNHHCVTRALQYHSSPGHDLLEAGFLAKTRAEEKWNGPTARVYVTEKETDVTLEVLSGLLAITDPSERYNEFERRSKRLVERCERGRPELRCQLSSYFGGEKYVLVERLEIKDVRLVYAPRRAIGSFGGDIDNWRWPRHSGDFAFYRAYVGKDGKPAAHSPDNVAYRPPQYLKIATRPLEQGDLVFVAGYPGRTDQLATPREIDELTDWYFPRQIKLCEENIAVIEAVGQTDEDAKLKGTPASRGLNNWMKFMRGARQAMTAGGVAKKKQAQHAALLEFANATAQAGKPYKANLEKLDRVLQARQAGREARAMLDEFKYASQLLSSATRLARLARERAKPDAERDPDYQLRNHERLRQESATLNKLFNPALDKARLVLALERSVRSGQGQSAVVKALLGEKPATSDSIESSVTRLFEQTRYVDEKLRAKWFELSAAEFGRLGDPLIEAARRLAVLFEEAQKEQERLQGELLELRPAYVAALRAFRAGPLAPDANATLRITFGTVKGYRPSPESETLPSFTRASGVQRKHTGQRPFDAPPELLAAISRGEFGPYRSTELGDLPVDFISDLHITGGNSGSPTLNASGELVGLAFDGNYEAMASDWYFLPEITRSIHVDIRYVLWIMDAVDGADHLLTEMGLSSSLP